MIKIWDLWIRLFHWSLVIAVSFQLISGETGAGFFDWHRLVGEVVLALIVFRLLWGIVGSSNARLTGLIASPRQVLLHLRDLLNKSPEQDRGHNAAGGWAVLVMLLLIATQAGTGVFIADDEEWVEGAFFGALSTNTTDLLYNIHHINAGLLQALVLVHILMVAVYFFVGKQNLVLPMITGMMKWLGPAPAPVVKFAGFFTGLAVVALAYLLMAFTLNWY